MNYPFKPQPVQGDLWRLPHLGDWIGGVREPPPLILCVSPSSRCTCKSTADRPYSPLRDAVLLHHAAGTTRRPMGARLDRRATNVSRNAAPLSPGPAGELNYTQRRSPPLLRTPNYTLTVSASDRQHTPDCHLSATQHCQRNARPSGDVAAAYHACATRPPR